MPNLVPINKNIRVVAIPHPFQVARVERFLRPGLTLWEILQQIQPDALLNANACIWIAEIPGGKEEFINRSNWGSFYPKAGSDIIIRIVPGGNMFRMILNIFVMLAVIVATAVLTGPGGIWAGSLIAKLLIGGMGMLIMMGMNALIPPTQPKQLGGGSQSSTYGITGGSNKLDAWGVVPKIFGKHKISPPYGAMPYTEIIGNEQYFHCLFIWGYGPLTLDLDTLKIKETLFSKFQDIQSEHRYMYTTSATGTKLWHADTALTLFPKSVYEEDLTTVLRHAGDNSGWQQRTTQTGANQISVDISFLKGLYGSDAQSGVNLSESVTIQMRYKHVSVVSTWTSLPSLTTTASKTSCVRNTYKWTPTTPPEGEDWQYDVSLNRVSDDLLNAPRRITECTWTALRTHTNEDPCPLRGFAKTALRIRASEQLNGVIQELSGVVQAILPDWDTTTQTWITRETSSPAAAYREVHQGTANKRALADSRLDLDTIQEWSEICEAENREFNAVIDFSSSVQEIRQDAAFAGRAVPIIKDGKFSVVWDGPRDTIVDHITSRNSWDYNGEINYPDMPHGWRVQFINRNKDWTQDERIVLDDGYQLNGRDSLGELVLPGSTLITATKFEQLTVFGITDPDQAWKEGRYHIASARLRPETHTVNMQVGRLIVTKGDLVRFTHDVPLFGLGTGRVKSIISNDDDTIAGVILDEQLAMEEGKDYNLRFRLNDGSSLLKTVSNDSRYTTELIEVVQSANCTPDSGTDIPLVLDTAPTPGNILVAFTTRVGWGDPTTTPPDETWIKIDETSSNYNGLLSWYKLVVTGDGTDYTFVVSTSNWHTGAIYEISGADPENAIGQHGDEVVAGGTVGTTPVIIPTTRGAMVLAARQIEGTDDDNFIGVSAGWTEVETANRDLGRSKLFTAVRDSLITNTTEETSCSFTTDTSNQGCTAIVAIFPLQVPILPLAYPPAQSTDLDWPSYDLVPQPDHLLRLAGNYDDSPGSGKSALVLSEVGTYSWVPDWAGRTSHCFSNNITNTYLYYSGAFPDVMDLGDTFTIITTFKTASVLPAYSEIIGGFKYLPSPDRYWGYGLRTNYGTLSFSTWDETAGNGVIYSNLQVNSWYHILVTAADGICTLYVNGQQVDQNLAFISPGNNDQWLSLYSQEGSKHEGTAWFKGTTLIATQAQLLYDTWVDCGGGRCKRHPDLVEENTTGINLASFLFDEAADEGEINIDDLVMFGETTHESVEMLVKEIQSGPDLSAKITLIDYSPDIYLADDHIIPPHDSQISIPQEWGVPTVENVRSDDSVLIQDAAGLWLCRILVTIRKLSSFNLDTGTRGFEPNLTGIECQYWETAPAGGTAVKRMLPVTSIDQGEVSIMPVESTVSYSFRLRYVHKDGSRGDWTSEYTEICMGKSGPPEDIENLATVYRDGRSYLAWDAVIDKRPVQYQIRKGDTWGLGEIQDTIVAREFLVRDDGTYWVAAYAGYQYSLNPADILISGATISANAVAVYDEQADGFDGTKTNCEVSGGNLIVTDLTSEATYEIPADHILDLGTAQPCIISVSLGVFGAGPEDDIYLWDDLYVVADIYGTNYADKVTAAIQIAIAPDSGTFGDWQSFISGVYIGRKFKFQLVLNSLDEVINPTVTAFSFTIDMPDREERGQNILCGTPSGKTVTFTTGFQTLPNIRVSVLDPTLGDWIDLGNSKTKTGFTVIIKNSSTPVTRSIDWCARGF
jgi:hypothetical protein